MAKKYSIAMAEVARNGRARQAAVDSVFPIGQVLRTEGLDDEEVQRKLDDLLDNAVRQLAAVFDGDVELGFGYVLLMFAHAMDEVAALRLNSRLTTAPITVGPDHCCFAGCTPCPRCGSGCVNFPHSCTPLT